MERRQHEGRRGVAVKMIDRVEEAEFHRTFSRLTRPTYDEARGWGGATWGTKGKNVIHQNGRQKRG